MRRETGPPDQAADAYMTLVGYFNSLRELGGMRRLVEDALSIPDKGNEVAEAVQALWNYLLKVDSQPKLAMVREMMPEVEAGLAGCSDAEVLEAIEARRNLDGPQAHGGDDALRPRRWRSHAGDTDARADRGRG